MKSYQHINKLIKRQSLTIPSSFPENRSILDTYFTMEKRINIGQLFYYRERDQYWTTILLWRKQINIGHIFYYGENGSILDTYFTMEKMDQYLEN